MKTRKRSYLPRFKEILLGTLMLAAILFGFFEYLFWILSITTSYYFLNSFGFVISFIATAFLLLLYPDAGLLLIDYLGFKSTN
jgi:hypothetical protein